MANLDTALKRASGVSVSLPWRTPAKYPPSATFGAEERAVVAFMYGGIAAGVYVPPVVTALTASKRHRGKYGKVKRLADLADLLAQQQADEVIGKAQIQALQATEIEFARRSAYQVLKGLESAQEALQTIVKLEAKFSYTEEKLLKKKLQKLADEELSDWMLILALLD